MNKLPPFIVVLDEAKICQLVAVLEKMWPNVGGAKPDMKLVVSNRGAKSHKPKIDRVMVDRLKAMIRAAWPNEFGLKRAQLTVIQGGRGSAVAKVSP